MLRPPGIEASSVPPMSADRARLTAPCQDTRSIVGLRGIPERGSRRKASVFDGFERKMWGAMWFLLQERVRRHSDQ